MQPFSPSLRIRITAWYVLLVAMTLVAFSAFLYLRLQSSLLSQSDAALEATSGQALIRLQGERGRLYFEHQEFEYIGELKVISSQAIELSDGAVFQIDDETEISVPLEVGMDVEIDAETTDTGFVAKEVDEAEADLDAHTGSGSLITPAQLPTNEFVFRSLGLDGKVWDELGDADDFPLELPTKTEFVSLQAESGSSWRVHNLEVVSSDGQTVGWLQTAHSLDEVNATLKSVRVQLFWGIPLAVLLTTLGGLFLADRGLRPIGRITSIAQSITGSALNRRINYQGPRDEIGRLADTFDAMLNRLQGAFDRERRFTSDASHELRTPLTSLKGTLDVTLGSPRSISEYEDTLRGLNVEVERLIRLSSELLYLARMDQGQLSLQPEDIALDAMLGGVLDQIRPLAEAKGLTLIEEVPMDIVVRGDSDSLIRLFLNLADNAYKFTPSPGRITVKAEKNTSAVCVAISDTGPGIPEEHLPHIFDRFYRVDEARSRDSGGTGLGLSIAYEIAQLHNGTLEVKSKVGSGTVFKVSLPVEIEG